MPSIEELSHRYKEIYQIDSVDELILNNIESTLTLDLPNDFRKITSFYSGGLFGGISNFAIALEGICPNIVDETIRLRNTIKLPLRFVVLAEPPESLIVMDTENIPAVIWCDATDAERLHNMSFISVPQTWDTYLEYFAGLLEDEEQEAF